MKLSAWTIKSLTKETSKLNFLQKKGDTCYLLSDLVTQVNAGASSSLNLLPFSPRSKCYNFCTCVVDVLVPYDAVLATFFSSMALMIM